MCEYLKHKKWYSAAKHILCDKIKDELNAVILPTDKAAVDWIDNEQGKFYDTFVNRTYKYTTAEIVSVGCNGILIHNLRNNICQQVRNI